MNYYNKFLFLKGGNFGTNIPDDFSLDFYKKNIIVNDTLTINDVNDLDEITTQNINPEFLNKIKHVEILTSNFAGNDLNFFLMLPAVNKLTILSYVFGFTIIDKFIIVDNPFKNFNELIILTNNNSSFPNNLSINTNCINLKKIIINGKFNISPNFKFKQINKLEELIFNEEYNDNIVLIDNPELKLIIVKNIDFDKSIMLENLPKLEKIDLPFNFKGTLQLKNMTNYINLLFSNHLKN